MLSMRTTCPCPPPHSTSSHSSTFPGGRVGGCENSNTRATVYCRKNIAAGERTHRPDRKKAPRSTSLCHLINRIYSFEMVVRGLVFCGFFGWMVAITVAVFFVYLRVCAFAIIAMHVSNRVLSNKLSLWALLPFIMAMA